MISIYSSQVHELPDFMYAYENSSSKKYFFKLFPITPAKLATLKEKILNPPADEDAE